jgi:hypothetical protein
MAKGGAGAAAGAAIVMIAVAACSAGDDGDPAGAGRAGEFEALSYNVTGLPEPLSGSEPATNTPLISPLCVAKGGGWLTISFLSGQPVKDSGPKRPHATKTARAR